MKRELIYPFFIECCKHTSDTFWKSIFEDLAYGITPYGTYINNNSLVCNYKDKEFVFKIKSKNSKELYDSLMEIFKTKLLLVSRDEIISRKKTLKTHFDSEFKEITCWSQIKKKKIKDMLLEKFAIAMVKKHSIPIKQMKKFMSLLNSHLMFKSFSSADVIIENGEIARIQGIDFEYKTINFTRNLNLRSVVSDTQSEQKMTMFDEWVKYLKDLKN